RKDQRVPSEPRAWTARDWEAPTHRKKREGWGTQKHRDARAMKAPRFVRPVAGALLCVVGFALAWPPSTPFRKTTVVVDAGGCRLVTDVIDRGDDETQGSVLLFHGLAANKKIMSYIAQGFALQNLRVFVPDLPGHGRTPGPFTFARSAACADAFVHQL